jgi:TolA-binding protein
MRDSSNSPSKQDPVAFAFLIAIGLAAAVATGSALSSVASGAAQDLLRAAGFGRDTAIEAEQHRQGAVLARLENSLGLVRNKVAQLSTRADETDAQLRASSPPQAIAGEPEARVDDLEIGLASLRTSLVEEEERNREALAAVNKRVDWLETLVYGHDATGSVQGAAPPAPGSTAARRRGRQSSGWYVLHAETGVAVISGKGGIIDVTPGLVIPEFGRVAAIRQQGGHWEVVTDKGTIRER